MLSSIHQLFQFKFPDFDIISICVIPSCLQIEPMHILDERLLFLRRPRKAPTGIKVVSLFPEMGLDVFHGPMLSGDPGESLRAEAGRLGDPLPRL